MSIFTAKEWVFDAISLVRLRRELCLPSPLISISPQNVSIQMQMDRSILPPTLLLNIFFSLALNWSNAVNG